MDYSSFFVRDPSFSHLNAGTRTRVPLRALDFIDRENRERERNPTAAMFTGYDRLWEAQKRVAQFLGASPHDLFLRNNVTSAFNDFLFALPDLGEGHVVATSWEYGGTLGLLRHWASARGHEVRTVPLPLRADVTAPELEQIVLGALTPQTRVLLLSHVATATGAVLPVESLAARARERGVITVIDGAHAVGALPVSLRLLEADFYGGNFHKWFLGPEGTGFGWVHPRWQERLNWKFGGWASVSPPSFYQNFGDRRAETCRRLFPGTIDRVPFLALTEVLSFWEEHGAAKLRARQTELRDLAGAEALGLGWEPRSPALCGPLVCFVRPQDWAGEPVALATRLYKEARVQLALPEVGGTPLVRLSPGVYATADEIRGAFQRLRHFRAS